MTILGFADWPSLSLRDEEFTFQGSTLITHLDTRQYNGVGSSLLILCAWTPPLAMLITPPTGSAAP